MSNKPTTPVPTSSTLDGPHPRAIPKALTFALWLTSLSLITIAACTIYFVVITKDFMDATDTRLNALSNNTLGIYAALAGDEYVINDFAGFRFSSVDAEDRISIRRALYNIMDEIQDAGGSS